MTTLKQKIQSDYLEAFKSKNALVKNLLSVVKGEIQMQEKNTIVESLSDDEVIKILNKFAKNAKENIQALKNSNSLDALEKNESELKFIESYLPKQLSNAEIQNIVDKLVLSGVTNIGLIMKEFANLPVDKKVVSELVRNSIK